MNANGHLAPPGTNGIQIGLGFNFFDTSKPREERDYKEIYPDLNDSQQLKVFLINNEKDDDENIVDQEWIDESVNTYGKRPIPELKKPTFTKKIKQADINQAQFSNNFKLNKTLSDYGFQDPSKVKLNSFTNKRNHNNNTYIRPFQLNSNETIESKIFKKQNQVEYDMDEQDFVYLQDRNKQSTNVIKLKPEIFEILITILENEWSKIELQMNNANNNPNNPNNMINTNEDINQILTLDEYSSFDKYGNDDGITNSSFLDQKCAVCNDSDCDNSNAIVFCDGCNIGVHQECYGIAFIPEGQWLCRKCMINQNNRSIECCLCPSKSGAFKQLDNSLWSHVICALWINELYFANPIYMEPIEGIDLIPKNRWKLICYICKQKKGACIQCSNRNCFQAYHVTCGKRAGIYMNMTKGLQGAISNKLTMKSYCDKHSPSYWNQQEVINGIKRTRLYYQDLKLLNEQNDKLTSKKKLANKLNNFKWKTENNTPIAPKKFSDLLFKTMINLRVEDSTIEDDLMQNKRIPKSIKDLGYKPNRSKESIWQEIRNISNEICKYWCLKREYKNGAPLIRKNNNLILTSSILYGNNSIDEINEKLFLSNLILKDLTKLIELSEKTMHRQLLVDNIEYNDNNILDLFYFPLKILIKLMIDKVNKKNDSMKLLLHYKFKSTTIIHQNIDQIMEKNENLEYHNVSEVVKDVNDFYNQVMNENKPSTNIIKVLTKWYRDFNKSLPNLLLIETKINEEFNQGGDTKSERNIKVPFIEVNGSNTFFKNRDIKKLLTLMELGEIDNQGNEILINEQNDNKIDNVNVNQITQFSEKDNERLFNQFLYG